MAWLIKGDNNLVIESQKVGVSTRPEAGIVV